MEGFLIFAFVIFLTVIFFRYLRKREIAAFREMDMGALQSFNAEREKAGKEPVVVPDEALIAQAAKLVSPPEESLEVELREGLFDEIHRHFYLELERAVEKQLLIFVQVPLNALIRGDSQIQNRLKHKSISFVLCNPLNLKVIAGFQLKNAGSDAVLDDELKARIFAQIKVPLITFPMIGGISTAEIFDQLGPVLREIQIDCPACGGDMALRKAGKGKSAGRTFKVCRQYPSCKGRILVSPGILNHDQDRIRGH